MNIGAYDHDDVKVKGVNKDHPDDNDFDKKITFTQDADDSERYRLDVSLQQDQQREMIVLLRNIYEQLKIVNRHFGLVNEVDIEEVKT